MGGRDTNEQMKRQEEWRKISQGRGRGAKKGGSKTRPASGRKFKNYHCDDAEDEMQD